MNLTPAGVPMILSRKFGFIFLKTKKTAGTSFEIALCKYAGPEDIVTPISEDDENTRQLLGYQGPRNFGPSGGLMSQLFLGKRRATFYNHMPAAELKSLVGDDVFERMLKVAVVRNPFDLVISRYFWDQRGSTQVSKEHFRRWVLEHGAILNDNRSITHINEVSVLNITLRFERLSQDIEHFARSVGLPTSLYAEFAEIRAKGNVRPSLSTPREMFEGFEEGIALVRKVFIEDITLFGYSL